jgi:hypothetical protein
VPSRPLVFRSVVKEVGAGEVLTGIDGWKVLPR